MDREPNPLLDFFASELHRARSAAGLSQEALGRRIGFLARWLAAEAAFRVLRRLWALLWLPAQLRRAWEQRFPVLGLGG
jgi:transcriptional regulator with XRE-family HTH domain